MIIVADNLQITDPAIDHAVREENPAPIRELVKACEMAGAHAIDINSGPLSKEPEKRMTFLVETVQSVTNLPLFIDTANPDAMAAGLSVCQNRAVINGFSLEPKKLDAILPLAAAHDADIIGYLLYPDSHVPPDAAERLAIAVEIHAACAGAGLDPARLIIDPIIAPLAWADGTTQNTEILALLRQLPDLLGYPVRTIGGLSNLTTGPAPREKKRLMERTYLPMLAASGLSFVLMNVLHRRSIETAKACNALTAGGIFSWASLP